MSAEINDEIKHLRKGLSAAGDLLANELADFPEARMDFCQDEPVWARWSAEVQLRHIACVPCRWLLGIFRESLEAQGYSLPDVDMKTIAERGGRHVPPEICPDRASLIAHTRRMFDFCIEILDRQTPESFRALTCIRLVDTEIWREDAPERPIDLWRMLAELHPYGVHEDPDTPGNFPMELIAVIRQIYWELLAHLRSIQRLKGLLELPVVVNLPKEGYLTVSKFYD
ncbi:MAG: hypothetical protein HOJ95_09600 [Nitrospinaceae bacterium]|nr:hypothetical protein [Nitrospinaceae bacterium]MBT3432642.1 hypothetical protein [Nitrospinaceae bacterium]MBT3820627.1 hypothetical protein [Nitrospinaceae bacterium]MBT4094217.1 hypothetical protein [Nitrospinaceae bacterium]MBT5366523.1 hypothetical protein [Nitrospinaceae bacterium]